MIASDLSDLLTSIAIVIGAMAFLTVAVSIPIALHKSRKVTSHIVTKLGSIDLAVNGVKGTDEDPVLVEKVRRIERDNKVIVTVLQRICDHLGIPFHRDINARERAADTSVA